MGDRGRLVPLVTALAAVVMLGACSLGEKQELADRVVRARSLDAGTRAAVISVGFELLEMPAGFEVPVPEGAAPAAGASLGGGAWEAVVSFADGRSAVVAPANAAARIAALAGAAPSEAPLLLVADDESLLVRRPAGQVVAARPWFRLALDRAKETSKPDVTSVLTSRSAGDAAVLTPSLMLDLLAGVLPGSVEERDGAVTGRFSFDKAAREDDLSDDEIEAREHAFRLFAITDDVHDFEVVLDDEGTIESLRFRLKMTPDKVNSFELTWTMEVKGDAPAISVPDAEAVVSITSFNQARNAVDDWMLS